LKAVRIIFYLVKRI